MFVSFIQKEERLDLTKPDGNYFANAAGLISYHSPLARGDEVSFCPTEKAISQ